MREKEVVAGLAVRTTDPASRRGTSLYEIALALEPPTAVRIHPSTPARALSRSAAEAMWSLLIGLLRRGVEEKRIVTTHGLALAVPRVRVPRAESVHVYVRRTCRSCGGAVQRFTQRARTAYVWVTCQPFVDGPAVAR